MKRLGGDGEEEVGGVGLLVCGALLGGGGWCCEFACLFGRFEV